VDVTGTDVYETLRDIDSTDELTSDERWGLALPGYQIGHIHMVKQAKRIRLLVRRWAWVKEVADGAIYERPGWGRTFLPNYAKKFRAGGAPNLAVRTPVTRADMLQRLRNTEWPK
jgi:hypothetical protein